MMYRRCRLYALCKTISFQSTTPKRHSVVEARIRVLEHLCPGLIVYSMTGFETTSFWK